MAAKTAKAKGASKAHKKGEGAPASAETSGPMTDFLQVDELRQYMTERGKILGARFTGLPAKKQRQLKRAIRRARVLGLLP